MKKDNKQKEEYAERMNNDINSELKSFDTKLASCQKQLNLKIEFPDVKSIWNQFDRFALYQDLKDLHGMVLPKIAEFESKIQGFTNENDKTKAIIDKFDHNIAQKANKLTL